MIPWGIFVNKYTIGIAIAASIVGGAYFYGRSVGAENATARCERAKQVEILRQTEANREAKEREERVNQLLRSEIARLRQLQLDNADEAANDPDADRVCLGPDSLRRLNRYAPRPD